MNLKALAAPFPVDAVSWRVGSTNAEKTKGMALAYIDARDVMDRLDEIVGPENWRDEYTEIGGFFVCKLWVRVGGEWIWKCDGAGKTDVEGEKGMVSDAFKRAAVKWGIGRYLYSLDSPWVTLNKYRQIEDSERPKLLAVLTRKSASLSQSQPKQQEAPAPRASAPPQIEPPPQAARPGLAQTAVARVAAPPSIKDSIPTVAPSKPKPEGWKDRERLNMSKGAADKLIQLLDDIHKAIGISKVEIIKTQFEGWKPRAENAAKHINDADWARVEAKVAAFKEAVANEKAARLPDHDADTGEIREAAE